MYPVKAGDPAPSGPCVWKMIGPNTYAIKVTYTNAAGEQLYAVYTNSVATGEHLTLPEVIARVTN